MSTSSGICHEHFVAVVKFFLTFSFFYYCCEVSGSADKYIDYLLCRSCGHELIHPSSLIQIPSEHAIRQRNDTISGKPEVLIQLFKNPNGLQFEVITAKTMNSIDSQETFHMMTWFTGYKWGISVCPVCHHHIGWKYILDDHKEGLPSTFYGIILANILQQSESESIIHFPKAYNS